MRDALPVPKNRPLSWSSLSEGFARNDFLPSLPTALLCWFLTVIFSVSLAALIFRGALAPSLSLGITMSLITATISGLAITLLGSLPGTISIPSDRTAPMLGIMTAALVASFPATEKGDVVLETCLAALMATTLLTGITLALLGHYRLGRIVRFLPLPVVGGFMAGAGWLMAKGALTVLTGHEPTLSNGWQLFQEATLARWVPSLALAVVLVFANRRSKHFLVIPSIVVVGVIIFYLTDEFTGVSLERLRVLHWLPGPFPQAMNWQAPSLHLIDDADWRRIFASGNAIATVLLVSATSLLMISSAMELSANAEVDADRELEAAGIANLVAAAGGGLVGFHSLSITNLSVRIGPRSRWIGLLTAVGCGLTLLVGPNLVSYLPVPVLGGLLLYLGLNFLMEWVIDARKRMPQSDYLTILLILVVMASAGYLVGVGVGLVVATGLFALRYSRVDIVRLELSGVQQKSNVDRSPEQEKVLAPLRPAILILKLQGFIFFGTAHSLLQRIRLRAHDVDEAPLQYVFLDFRHVTGIDSSTLLSFTKLLQLTQKHRFKIIFTGIQPLVLQALLGDAKLFDDGGFLLRPDLDHGLEWCEEVALAAHQGETPESLPDMATLLATSLPGRAGVAWRIIRYFTPYEGPSGAVLAVQGDRTRDLFLIQRGQVSAFFRPADGEAIRLRTLGPGSVVGEIGLYLGLPRTASLVVDTDSLVWCLAPEALAKMEVEDPQAALALHEFLARTIANRLVLANELLEATLR